MSYSSELKASLFEKCDAKKCCQRALFLGLCLGGAHVEGGVLSLTLPSEALAEFAEAFSGKLRWDKPSRLDSRRGGFHRTLLFPYRQELHAPFLLPAVPEAGRGTCSNCRAHYFRGLFCAAGRMTDFRKAYRLEFTSREKTEAIAAILTPVCGEGRIVERRGERVLYFKKNAELADFFAAAGAEALTYSLIEESFTADARADANRMANCETGNIGRSIKASMKLLPLLQRLEAEGRLTQLSDELEATARLRLENPSASLAVLALLATPPVTKSGMNHRLEKLFSAAKEILLASDGANTEE